MTLRVRFWGTRGSVPAPGAATARYGGNTPCVEVRTPGGALLIFDAGTGIRELGNALTAAANGGPVSADIFLSHSHWDHIQGIPYFAPLFVRGNRITLWSSPELMPGLHQALHAQMSPSVFPVPFGEVAATVAFRTLDRVHRGADFLLQTIPVRHPGGALGYRMSAVGERAGALVYVSDNELDDAPAYPPKPGWREEFVAFARGASLLVHDAMYTAEEYALHRGWGHSHLESTVTLAIDAGVDRLALFHHSPDRLDADVDRLLEESRAMVKRRGAPLQVLAAAEGLTLTV